MKRLEKLPFILFIVTVAASLLSVTARIILTLTALEAEYGVYYKGRVLPTVYHIALAVLCAALIAIAVIKAPKRSPEYMTPQTNATLFCACAVGFLMIFEALISLYHIVTKHITPTALESAEIALAILSSVYFFSFAAAKKERSGKFIFLSFFPTLWCAVSLIMIYFDSTTLLTSPNKIIGEMALVGAMLFFLSESRVQLGAVSHKFHLAIGTVTPILLFTSAVPNLILSDKLSIGASDSYMRYATEAVMALFMLARLAAYAKTKAVADETIGVIENR